MAYVDTCVSRSVPQAAKAMGLEGVTNLVAAVARAVELGFQTDSGKGKRASHQHVIAVINQHAEAIDFAVTVFPSRRRNFARASVLAPIARAWYSQDRARLAEFGHVVCSNEPADPTADQAA
jgi:hypothetical protein